jgi:hypothetical protein
VSPPHTGRERTVSPTLQTLQYPTNLAHALGMLSRWRLPKRTGRQKMVLERWTNPKLSQHAFSCELGRIIRGEGNRRTSRNGRVSDLSHPKIPTVAIRTFASLHGWLCALLWPTCYARDPGFLGATHSGPSPLTRLCGRGHALGHVRAGVRAGARHGPRHPHVGGPPASPLPVQPHHAAAVRAALGRAAGGGRAGAGGDRATGTIQPLLSAAYCLS